MTSKRDYMIVVEDVIIRKLNIFMQPSEQLNAQTINGLNLYSYTNDFSSTFKTNTKENMVANNVF